MSAPDSIFDTWNSTTDDELTLALVEAYFSEIVDDELYVASAALDRLADDLNVQRLLLEKAILATEAAVEKGKEVASTRGLLKEAGAGETVSREADEEEEEEPTGAAGSERVDERLARLLALRSIALKRRDLVDTYEAISLDPSWLTPLEVSSPPEADDDDDDPWADDDTIPLPSSSTSESPSSSPTPPIILSQFLDSDLVTNAIQLANASRFSAIHILLERHGDLVPYRFAILDSIPPFINPQAYKILLPTLDQTSNAESIPPPFTGREPDWVESDEAKSLYGQVLEENYSELIPAVSLSAATVSGPLSVDQLTSWYRNRIGELDGEVGLTDNALELVQHAASHGIPGLDEIGEELSLLSRLVYDTPGATDSAKEAKTWSLDRWKKLSSREVVNGYLARSTPSTIADDIRRLVNPYLFVLEARAERAGTPDPELPARHLYDYILNAPLPICAVLFDISKPTMSTSRRIIKDDEDLARLALARLYGSPDLDQWPAMSRIFECMPDWPLPSPETIEDGALSADTTLTSLASFVQPSTARANASPPPELFVFFKPLPSPALSRALDILDMHLECGEILSRWGVPAPLAWFLQSSLDVRQQTAWATRMARRAIMVQSEEDEVLGVDKERRGGSDGSTAYAALLRDMLKLVGPSEERSHGAFRLLGKEEVTKIFFGGLLSSGKFEVAKKFLTNPNIRKLSSKVIEDLCLSVSREFYDNSSSGNLNTGDMKLAYDCLTVPAQTPAVRAEREFIEATSRICSFKVVSRPGILITPIEIRLVKDRLSLVARVLSENDDAYKFPEVILELVHKLGYKKGDIVSEVKARAMLADSALQSEDFERAAETVETMVKLLGSSSPLPSSRSFVPESVSVVIKDTAVSPKVPAEPPINEALEVCWRSCFQLGRQSEYSDTKRRLKLLGQALRICPPENTLDILTVWRRLEQEDIEDNKDSGYGRRGRRTASSNGSKSKKQLTNGSGRLAGSLMSPDLASLSGRAASIIGGHLSDYTPSEPLLHQGADVARQTLSRVAANFPLSSLRGIRGRAGSSSAPGEAQSERSSSRSSVARSVTPDVSSQARHALSRGMGWLIGDED